jgi:hypothetical protein
MRKLLYLGVFAVIGVLAYCALATAALPTTITVEGFSKLYQGTSTADNEIVIETDDVTQYGTCLLQSTAGVMDVVVSVDGVNFATDPYQLSDRGSVDPAPVLETAAGRTFGIRGVFKKVRVLQKGAVAVTGAALRCGVM